MEINAILNALNLNLLKISLQGDGAASQRSTNLR